MSSHRMFASGLAAVCLALCAGACAGAPLIPDETADTFIIERDLLGSSVARGEFSAITGVRRGFTAYLDGRRDGDTFTLAERFVYDDGETDQKTWVLTLMPDGQYSGVREDVVGAARGWQDDAAFRLEYDVRLPDSKGEPGFQVRFRDVMVKTDEGVVVNRATIGKWGFKVGRVDLSIRPAEQPN